MDAIEGAIRSAVPNLNLHVFTHMSHIYSQGASIYTSYIFPNGEDYDATLSYWRAIKDAASKAVVGSGGTISHQHGVGRDHAPYLGVEKGSLGLKTIGALVQHFDPNGVLNTGVLLSDGQNEND